jgi:hypothetical protein
MIVERNRKAGQKAPNVVAPIAEEDVGRSVMLKKISFSSLVLGTLTTTSTRQGK